MKIKKQIEELETQLNMYEYYYRVLDNPLVSDQEFDKKMKHLKELSEKHNYSTSNSPLNKIGAVLVDGFEKCEHKRLMGSIGNVYTFDELEEWFNKFDSKTIFKLEDKYDGMSGSLHYENGRLIKALTRGKGDIGDDITENAKMVWNVKHHIASNNVEEIRGEFVIFKKDFERVNVLENAEYKNPRNLVSGTMKSLKSKVVKDRFVHFIPFQAFDQNGEIDYNFSEFCNLSFVSDMINFSGTKEDIKNQIFKIDTSKSWRNKTYMTDGLVVKVENLNKRDEVGYTSGCPNWAIAFKFEQEKHQSIITNIIWQVGTRHITPVAVVEPVEIEGTTVTKASLHNLTQYNLLQITVGDVVEIEKAGFIIPHITKNISAETRDKKPFLFTPKNCPHCSHPTSVIKKESEFLICSNKDCDGKRYVKFENFLKCLNVKDIGPSIVKQLIDKKIVNEISDFFTLDIKDILLLDRIGKKTANKIINNIKKAEVQKLENIINSLGIHNVGEGSSQRLSDYCKTFEKFINIDSTEMLQIKDFGEETVNSIVEYRKDNQHVLKSLLSIFILYKEHETLTETFKDLTFVVTGKATKPRGELEKLIKDNGGKISKSMSSKVDMLILGSLEDESFNSNKVKKAKELNKTINDEFYLYDILNIKIETKAEEKSELDDLF